MDREDNMARVRAEMGLEGVGDAINISCPSCPFIAVSHAQFSVQARDHLGHCKPPRDVPDLRETQSVPATGAVPSI